MGPEYVKIGINELANLLKKADELEALEAGGVDNWQWYGESLNDNFDYDFDYKEYILKNYEEV